MEYFQKYQRLSTKEQKIEFQRRNEFTRRCDCCYEVPSDPKSADGIDPRAVLWRQRREAHRGGKSCGKCPFCILFPALTLLYQLSSHVALLQVTTDPAALEPGSKEHKKAIEDYEKAQTFLPENILDELPGMSYVRNCTVTDDHFRLSGKMKVLDEILKDICRDQGRVLLFSASTQSLDLIENYVRTSYKYLRMDGSTPAKQRQVLADQFKKDPTILVFLLSTRAMGLGLNLTEADNVIIFDVEWNPSNDTQAQDRYGGWC